MRDEALIASLGLGGDQHFLVTQRLDIIDVRQPTPAALLLRMSGLQLHRARLVGDKRRAHPEIILAPGQQMPAEYGELAGDGHGGDLVAALGADTQKKARSGPGALAAAHAASTSMARA